MRWHGIKEQAEAMTLLIHNAHALGQSRSAEYLASEHACHPQPSSQSLSIIGEAGAHERN